MIDCCSTTSGNSSFTPEYHSEKYPIFCAIGIILMVGAIFLFLASEQIFPNGPNEISDWGIWGRIGENGAFLFGGAVTSISATAWYFAPKSGDQQIINQPEEISSLIPEKKEAIITAYPAIDHKITEQFRQRLPEAHYYFIFASNDRTPEFGKKFIEFCTKAKEINDIPIVVVKIRMVMMSQTVDSTIETLDVNIDNKAVTYHTMTLRDYDTFNTLSDVPGNNKRVDELKTYLSQKS